MKTFTLFLSLASLGTFAQENTPPNLNPQKQWYGMSAHEWIFSGGSTTDSSASMGNTVRFSAFLNVQHQAHFDFGRHAGLYTGIGIRNVGFINKLMVPNEKEATIKQRSYSLGVPLALKLGNMEKGNFLAFGVEGELMFNYKRKVFFNGSKSKFSEWFSDDVNLFNPSLFAEIHGHKGTFIRFKYYLFDFLIDKNTPLLLPQSLIQVNYRPEKSTLFYVSIGSALKIRKKHHATVKEA